MSNIVASSKEYHFQKTNESKHDSGFFFFFFPHLK